MDNTGGNIDHIFKARFTDAKDFSVDPKAAWQSIESGLNASAVSNFGASTYLGGKLAVMKMVAAFAGSLTLAGFLDSDQTLTKSNIDSSTVYHLSHTTPKVDSPANIETTNPFESSQSVMVSNSPEIAYDAETPDVTGFKASNSGSSGTLSDDNQVSSSNHPESSALLGGSSMIKTTDPLLAENNGSTLIRDVEVSEIERGSLRIMNSSTIVNAEIEEAEITAWNNSHMWFLRAGMRLGSGESNSFEIESEWKANPSFSFGYGFSLTDNSYITAELGWLRRSGNGIERTKDIDLNPLLGGIIIPVGDAQNGDLIIHESLVATRMDYIHVPINYNRQFAENWTFSAGGFMDLLISAKNDGYLVYNNTEYQASITGKSELSSIDGLNRIRYGATLGAERKLIHKMSAYGQLMVPLNSPIDTKSDYRIIDETNRLVDLKLGVVYRI